MAKTKISELVKEYGADGKEVIAFLNENGIEAKSVTKAIDDDAIALVAAKFGKKAAPSTSEAAPEKKPVVKAVKVAASDKVITPQAKTETAQKVFSDKPQGQIKKKKIIIVTGAGNNNQARPANNYTAGQNNGNNNNRPAQGQNRPQNNGRPQQNNNRPGNRNAAPTPVQAYRPIKPKTVPTQMTVDYHKPEDIEARRREAEKAAAAKRAAEEAAAAAKAAEEAAAKAAAEAAANATAQAQAPANDGVKPVNVRPQQNQGQNGQSYNRDNRNGQGYSRDNNRQGGYNNNGQGRRFDNNRQGGYNNNGQQGGYNQNRNGQGGYGNRQGGYNNQNGQNGQGGPRIRMNDGMGRNSAAGTYRNAQGGQGGYNQNRNGQGGYGQNRGGQGGFQGRPGQGGYGQNRGGQGGYGQNRGGQGGGFGAAAPAQAGFGGADARRRNNQFKDKRNKKDVAFAEDEQREKKNRSGRFIKPTVEVQQAPEEQIKVINIPEKLTIGELADAMHLKAAELIKKLFLAGKAMTVNSELSYEEAENIAADYDILCEKEETVDEIQELLKEDEEDESKMVGRAPVICVMGHVDHGKTSILDYIRDSHVTAKEAGGITQAIGAYTVKTSSGQDITFLDTPGHEAFTAMRLRGAMSTDIAVLVVAADDGVMPQTVEAINHAKAAGVEIIVAVNKIDKPAANPDKVKEQLSKYELIPTSWGGTTEFVHVSAKTGEGIEELLDTIMLTAEVMELKANPDRLARGLVLEARLDKGRGPVANVLVQKGTLHVGDFVSAGPAFGKVRAMINDKGQNVKEAGPSMPVMVMGLSDVPSAGEVIVAHENNDTAKTYAETYKAQHKEELVAENVMSMNVEDLFDQMREGKLKQLELIVKADVQGSVEALCASLQKLSNDEVAVKIIHSAVGNITESDVTLAEASNAAIIGFNVHPDATAKSIADHGNVSIHLYKVIYQAIDDVDAALKGMLAPVYEEKVIGHAEIRQIFKSGKIGNIAGSMVLDGVIEKGCSVRITRGKDQIFEGELESLKRFKDDVKEVKAGFDCGLVFKDFGAVQVDDQIEAYKMVEVPREKVIEMKEKAAREAAKKKEQEQ